MACPVAWVLSEFFYLMSQENNPYLTPTVDATPPSLDSYAEQIRKIYLKHEATVKSIGTLYLLGAIFMIPSSIFLLVKGSKEFNPIVLALLIVMGFAQLATGIALRRLRKWSRVVGVIFGCIGLLGFPMGTLISACTLYLLLCAKGTMVFSADYKQIIAETPHVKYRSSKVIKWLLLILIIIFVVILAIALSTS